MSWMGLAFAWWLAAGSLRGAESSGVIDDGQFATEAEAQAAWRLMGTTAPVRLFQPDDRKALKLPCVFAGSKSERASWDRRVTLDLTAARGIEFQLFCRDASPVSYFSVYLQSGDGWYHGTFYPESSNQWNTVSLDKSAFGSEGKPAGWGQIRTIRLSAWRGQERNTELWVRDLRVSGQLGREALVAILRAESAAQRSAEEARSVAQFTETTAQLLQSFGVGSAVISDTDATLERLRSARVVVLPYNGTLPDGAAQALKQYAAQGGRLLVFYNVPASLRSVLKVQGGSHIKESRPGSFAAIRPRNGALPGAPATAGQRSWNINAVQPVPGASEVLAEWLDDKGQPTGHAAIVGSRSGLVMTHVLLNDDPRNKARLLLAMAGYLAPELWRQAAETSLGQVGKVGPARDFEQASAAISQLARADSLALETLKAAGRSRDEARAALGRGDFAAAMDLADAARQQVTEAWCRAQPSLPGEFRAFWCHSAFGVQGMTWDEALGRMATNGFTAILPNMLWGGVAFYESRLLPVSPEVAKRGDQIALCLAAARRHGIQVHVWKVNWNLGHAVPAPFLEKMRRAQRLQFNSRGKEEPWLCPSHPENQKLEIESMVEVARNYDVDGIHFDYIRYPDSDHCFCAGCKERFQRATGQTLAQWPRDVMSDSAVRQQWLDWRRTNITIVVRAVAEQAHALKPKLKISAAVFRNWATDRDGVGQDWKLWCDRGWLDFVCPMDYTPSHRQFENMVARQVEWAGRTPVYPGIGESASSSRLGADGVIEQIQISRRYKTGGFVIFNYGVPEAKELLPLLGLGITARP